MQDRFRRRADWRRFDRRGHTGGRGRAAAGGHDGRVKSVSGEPTGS